MGKSFLSRYGVSCRLQTIDFLIALSIYDQPYLSYYDKNNACLQCTMIYWIAMLDESNDYERQPLNYRISSVDTHMSFILRKHVNYWWNCSWFLGTSLCNDEFSDLIIVSYACTIWRSWFWTLLIITALKFYHVAVVS